MEFSQPRRSCKPCIAHRPNPWGDPGRDQARLELVFHVDLDRAIAQRIAHAKQGKPLGHLILIEEALVSLINASVENLAGTGTASTRTAGIGEVNALLFSGIEDVLIICAAKAGSTFDADLERSHEAVKALLLDNEICQGSLGSSEIPNPESSYQPGMKWRSRLDSGAICCCKSAALALVCSRC